MVQFGWEMRKICPFKVGVVKKQKTISVKHMAAHDNLVSLLLPQTLIC
jgi:hypothetical protein